MTDTPKFFNPVDVHHPEGTELERPRNRDKLGTYESNQRSWNARGELYARQAEAQYPGAVKAYATLKVEQEGILTNRDEAAAKFANELANMPAEKQREELWATMKYADDAGLNNYDWNDSHAEDAAEQLDDFLQTTKKVDQMESMIYAHREKFYGPEEYNGVSMTKDREEYLANHNSEWISTGASAAAVYTAAEMAPEGTVTAQIQNSVLNNEVTAKTTTTETAKTAEVKETATTNVEAKTTTATESVSTVQDTYSTQDKYLNNIDHHFTAQLEKLGRGDLVEKFNNGESLTIGGRVFNKENILEASKYNGARAVAEAMNGDQSRIDRVLNNAGKEGEYSYTVQTETLEKMQPITIESMSQQNILDIAQIKDSMGKVVDDANNIDLKTDGPEVVAEQSTGKTGPLDDLMNKHSGKEATEGSLDGLMNKYGGKGASAEPELTPAVREQQKLEEALAVMEQDPNFNRKHFARAEETAREMGSTAFLAAVKTGDPKSIDWEKNKDFSDLEKDSHQGNKENKKDAREANRDERKAERQERRDERKAERQAKKDDGKDGIKEKAAKEAKQEAEKETRRAKNKVKGKARDALHDKFDDLLKGKKGISSINAEATDLANFDVSSISASAGAAFDKGASQIQMG